MSKLKVTRRSFGALAALAWPVPGQSAESDPLRDLNLPAGLREELEKRAEAVLREARWLEELPLEGVAPGFVFRVD